MRIQKIDAKFNFGNTVSNKDVEDAKPKKPVNREIIDVIAENVKNPRDVNDCVAVPRGIFKAYMCLMAGTGLIGMSNFLPKKAESVKKGMTFVGYGLNTLSAYYFAKPFAFKGLSPTVKREEEK